MSNEGSFARLVPRFFSTEYRTDMTIHCLLKPFRVSLASEAELQLQAEETDHLFGVPHNSQWGPPEMKRHFSLDTFFSLCTFFQHVNWARWN